MSKEDTVSSLIFVILLWVFPFYGKPDVHDLVREYLASKAGIELNEDYSKEADK